MNILIGRKATDFYSKNSIKVTDLDNIVGTTLKSHYIKPNEVEYYLTLGWTVDTSTKNAFGCHLASKMINEYETYLVSYYSQIKPEHKAYLKKNKIRV